MKALPKAALCVVIASCGLTVSNCGPVGNGWTWKTGRSIDKVQSILDEYGMVSMSAPLLSEADQRFKYELHKTADQFFTDAQQNVQGRAAQSIETSFVLSLLASAQVDPTIMASFATQQAAFARNQAQQNQSDNLLAQAALIQFRADIEAANKETNSVDRQKKIAAAYKAYGEAIKPATAPTAPVADPGQSLPEAPIGSAPAVAATRPFSTTFADPGGLISGSNLLSDRAAMLISAGDTATRAIFEVLGDPAAAIKFSGKKVLFAVTMVSVNPGWRTRENYAADISIRVRYRYVPARNEVVAAYTRAELAKIKKPAAPAPGGGTPPPETQADKDFQLAQALAKKSLEDLAGHTNAVREAKYHPLDTSGALDEDSMPPTNPLVMAVAPMNDTQVLDLSNSRRDQVAFALELAAALRYAGLGAQADVMSSYAKRVQQDITTRTSQVTANTYSVAGGVAGIEVGPSLVAMSDPAHFGPPGNVLSRQAFPVLLIVGFDPSDLVPVKASAKNKEKQSVEALMERELEIGQTTNWKPLRAGLPRLSEADRLAAAVELRRASINAKPLTGTPDASRHRADWWGDEDVEQEYGDRIRGLANERIEVLRVKANGGFSQQYLPVEWFFPEDAPPPDEEVKVASVYPGLFAFRPNAVPATVTAVVTGKNLKLIDASKITLVVPGAPAVPVTAAAANGVIVVTVPLQGRLNVPLVLELPRSDGKGSVFSLPILGAEESNAFIERNTSNGKDRIEFQGVSDEVLKAEIERNKPAPAPPASRDGK